MRIIFHESKMETQGKGAFQCLLLCVSLEKGTIQPLSLSSQAQNPARI